MVKETQAMAYKSFRLPRPHRDAVDVPLKTSFFIPLHIPSDSNDKVDFSTITVQLCEEGGEPFYILDKGMKFADGYSGTVTNSGTETHIYIDTEKGLKPLTKYTARVDALSTKGYGMSDEEGSWSFTTGDEQSVDINYSLDVSKECDVHWNGQFFGGLLKPGFNTIEMYGTQRFDYIYSDEMKEQYPDAWNLFRLHRVTGFDYHTKPPFLGSNEPNVVREMETRHIISMEEREDGVLLKVEDFFGHEQYGVESNRPVSADYKPGDEILLTDGTNSARSFVISANDKDMTVLVSKFTHPQGGWKMDYYTELPTENEPGRPGLFSYGGMYLQKFNPSGTPVYYWGRLDQEFDYYCKKYGNRIALGFVEAPGDLSIDGQPGTTAKDLVKMHQVAYDMTSHFIDRYGDATLNWVWSVFNEPDLLPYWRNNDWMELQRFYDYTTDGILKAFEDKGYDSDLVVIGGLELGAVSGLNLKMKELLAHCSPTADKSSPKILEYNAAYEDPRLDGKRSRRVEELCSANNGKGAPLDFISIHTYNSSEWAAKKLIHAKQLALDIDPVYYEDLWINNFESMPQWTNFIEPGVSDWTLGNGYLPTWVSDYVSRLLQQAAIDPRFSYGESILTIWDFPAKNFQYLNDVTTEIGIGKRGVERTEIIPKPIFNFVNLLSTMSDDYWVLPQEQHGGHTVSGFASPTDKDIRMILYSHDIYDVQSRSEKQFNINIDLKGLEFDEVMVTEYQFDKVNNSHFSFAEKNKSRKFFSEEQFETLKELSTLKATNRTLHKVNDDGTLSLSLPVAANGANFVIIGEPYEETPAPAETPDETPYETPGETPGETPSETPAETPDGTPSETSVDTPAETPSGTQTPAETQSSGETRTPSPGEPTDDPSGEDKPKTGDSGIAYFAVAMLISVLVIVRYRKLICS